MAFENLEAELALLINQMDTPPEDPGGDDEGGADAR